jgi:hypothetical protein
MSTSETIPQNVVEVGIPSTASAGAPKPSSAITRMVGTPRKKSAYMIARTRSGKNTGPGRLRRTASASAVTRMIASAMQKIFTFSMNACEIAGYERRYASQSKNAALTSGQLGAWVTP